MLDDSMWLLFNRDRTSPLVDLKLGSRAHINILIKSAIIFEIVSQHIEHHQPLYLFWAYFRHVIRVIVIIRAYSPAWFIGGGKWSVIWFSAHELLSGCERVHHSFINLVKVAEFLFTIDTISHVELSVVHAHEAGRRRLEERRWSVYIRLRWWTRVYIRVRWGWNLMLRQVRWSHEHLKVVT